MITQEYTQGNHTIRIEQPESLEEAQKNNFKEGQNQKYFIDDQETENFMALIKFIIQKSSRNKKNFIPNDLSQKRKDMIEKQQKIIDDHYQALKKTYKDMKAPQQLIDTLDQFHEFNKKTNLEGLRFKR